MPDLLVYETATDYHLEMCPETVCPAPGDPAHARTHFRRTWGKAETVQAETVVQVNNPDGTVSEHLETSAGGPMTLDQIQREFTLLFEAKPPVRA